MPKPIHYLLWINIICKYIKWILHQFSIDFKELMIRNIIKNIIKTIIRIHKFKVWRKETFWSQQLRTVKSQGEIPMLVKIEGKANFINRDN